MSILSGIFRSKRYIKQTDGYKLTSEWTSAKDVEMDDGTNVESAITTLNTNLGNVSNVASGAKSTADSALTKANSASSTADSALTKANNNATSISSANGKISALEKHFSGSIVNNTTENFTLENNSAYLCVVQSGGTSEAYMDVLLIVTYSNTQVWKRIVNATNNIPSYARSGLTFGVTVKGASVVTLTKLN